MTTTRAIASLVLVSVASASDVSTPVTYKDGWAVTDFYQEVAACRSALVIAQAKAYWDKAIAAHQDQDKLRSEVISNLPAMDIPASNGCYCAVGEVAKEKRYSEYVAFGDPSKRLDLVAEKLKQPPCVDRVNSSAALLSNKEARDAVKLK